MKALISWAVSNLPAMNILMITILIIGYWALSGLNRETFPQFDLDMILVSVSYPGATPEEVEESICQKIEEGVRDIRGIKKITSSAAENMGSVAIELLANVDDPNRVLNEVESAVGRIPSFPELCERPEVRLLQMEETIIRVGVLGPADWSTDAQLRLREVAEKVRNELLRYPVLSRIDIVGGKDYQIDVEMDENTLRSYGLTLQEVANILASENHQQAGGTIRGRSQEILLRSDTKQDTGEGIAQLPLLGVSEGATLTVGDLGKVRDEFVDVASKISIRTVLPNDTEAKETRFSKERPFLAVAIQRNPEEDLFAMIDAVQDYLKKAELPQGYDLITWGDRSVEVRDRLEMLAENGIQGLLIVFLCLTLFLDLRLSCWVALGIPFALLGTCFVVSALGQTLNLISSFAFIMGLGIVVDDAIVIGENVYTHRMRGKSPLQAAIDGASEVFPSVFASVLTTIIAFMPLLFVAGMMGKMMYILPMVIISMLCFSLFESSTILPAHLSHKDNLIFRICRTVFYLFRWVIYLLQWLSRYAIVGMEWSIHRIYHPTLIWALHYRSIFVAMCVGLLIFSVGLIRGGIVPFVFFPRMDSTSIVCNVQFPNGTPEALTTYWADRIEEAYWRVSERIFQERGEQISVHSIRTIGSNMSGRGMGGGMSGGDSSHMASVEIELVDANDRTLESYKVVDLWREETGVVPGALQLTFDSAFGGPGGKAIEFKLVASAEYAEELEQAVERCKAKLATYEGVFDIRDDNIPGKWELQPKVKDFAVTQGIRQADIAAVLRNAYYGAEVMRLQRGRHEVKLMVRYPEDARRSLASFEELRVRMDGVERPIGELADITIKRGYSTINRIDQQRAITITADVNDTLISPNQVIQDLKGETRPAAPLQNASLVSIADGSGGSKTVAQKVVSRGFLPDLMQEFPHINIRWEGQREQEEESFDSLKMGFSMALLAMFVLLVMEFKSYTQPMIILSVIPFAAVVVVLGHALFGMQMTFMGVFGLIALAGIVINDAIVLVDFINKKVREEDKSVTEACIEAGVRRFRPVFLTTLTTVGGLFPICLETSFQAKMIIPMAFTLAVGTAGATVVTLYLVPVLYSLYDQFSKSITRRLELEHE